MAQYPKRPTPLRSLIGLLLLAGGIIGVPLFGFGGSPGTRHVVAYGLTMVALLVIATGIGMALTGRMWGILLSGYNMFSLSRLQMAGWTWIVMSAVISAAFCNVFGVGGASPDKALNIDINDPLLIAMGISIASGIAAPGVLSLKAANDTDTLTLQAARTRLGDGAAQAQGGVIARTDAARARVMDLLRSDDVATAGTIDLSKVQQLLITLVLWAVFVIMTIDQFRSTGTAITGLPTLSEKMVWLLGLSHAGYIAYKAVPKAGAQTASDADAAALAGAPANLLQRMPAATGFGPATADPRLAQG